MASKYFDLSFRGVDGRTPLDFGNTPLGANVLNCMYGKGGMIFIQNQEDIWIPAISDIFAGDCEILILVRTLRDSTVQYNNNAGIAPVIRSQDKTIGKCYYAANGSLPSNSRTASILFREFPGVGQLSLAVNTTALNSVLSPVFYNIGRYIRFRATGNSLTVRSWWEGESEPTVWHNTTTHAQYSSGYLGFIFQGLQSHCIVPFISIATDGDTAPTSMVKRKIEGIIYYPDNTVAVNCKVRLYFKATGKLITEVFSNSVGAYVFNVNVYEDELVQIIGVDKNNNEWKPPIHETYPIL